MIPKIQRGFRNWKSKSVEHADDIKYCDNIEAVTPNKLVCKVGVAPSVEATWSTLHYAATEASGDRSFEAILINGIREHPWFADSRGI